MNSLGDQLEAILTRARQDGDIPVRWVMNAEMGYQLLREGRAGVTIVQGGAWFIGIPILIADVAEPCLEMAAS
jgi:hypothetical protein